MRAGEGDAIEGLDKAISNLHYGDSVRIFIPQKLAYGSKRAGEIIAPFSNLMFELSVNPKP